MTTTAINYGAEYGVDAQTDGILAYISGGDYIADQTDTLVNALLAELRAEVEERLPEDVAWLPATSEFTHPIDVEMPDADEIAAIFAAAWSAVEDRYEQIERQLFGELPATIRDLEDALRAIGSPVHRARVAGMLVDAGMRAMAGRVRAEAIHQATRERSHAEVADLLGTGVPAIRKAIKEHNQAD